MVPVSFVVYRSFGREAMVDALRVTHWETHTGDDPGVVLHMDSGEKLTVAGSVFEVSKALLDAKRAAEAAAARSAA